MVVRYLRLVSIHYKDGENAFLDIVALLGLFETVSVRCWLLLYIPMECSEALVTLPPWQLILPHQVWSSIIIKGGQ